MFMAFLFPPAYRPPRRPAARHGRMPAAAERRRAAAYRDILDRHDDRLIRDIGLTREEIVGPERTFWSQWLKLKQPWQL